MDVADALTHASPVPHPILNPHTPLSYVNPGTAIQMSLGSYIVVGSSAVLLWDVLQNLPADLKLLAPSRIRPPTVAYLVSRVLSLAYVLWGVIFYTSPIGNCEQNALGFSILYPLSISASTLLLLCLMRLVYDDNLRIVGPFSVLWLCVLGETITVPFGVDGSAIGPTKYCVVSELRKYTLAAAVAPIIFDTALYIGIAFRLAATSSGKVSTRERVSGLLTGSNLPVVSKATFEHCRSYYVVTLSSNILTAIMVLSTVSIPLRTAFFVLNITLINIMACRAFRNTKLGIHQRPAFTSSSLLRPPVSAPRNGSSSFTLPPVRPRRSETGATGRVNFQAPTYYTQRPQAERILPTLSGYKAHQGYSKSRVAVNVIPTSPSSLSTSFGGEEGMYDWKGDSDVGSIASSHSGNGIPVYLPSEDSHRSAGKASSFLVI